MFEVELLYDTAPSSVGQVHYNGAKKFANKRNFKVQGDKIVADRYSWAL